MTTFHDVRFPENVSWGSSGGPEYKTQVFQTLRGFEKRNVDWAQPLMKFNIAYGIRTDADILSVIAFFNARQGRLNGFRYKNWANYKITNDPIAMHDGVNTTLPMYKRYGFGTSKNYKRIQTIVKGSVSGVTVNASPIVEGTDFSIDYITGEIALNDISAYGTPIYGTLEFDEPVRFDTDSIQSVIDKFNSQSLNNFPLVGFRSKFDTGSVFAPDIDSSGADPFYDNVNLILNFDDTAVLTTTVDQSSQTLAMTIAGDGTLTTSDFRHGVASFSAGTTGYVSAAGTTFNVDDQPYTVELFAQQPAIGENSQLMLGRWRDDTNQRSWVLLYDKLTTRLLYFVSADGTATTQIFVYPWLSDGTAFDYITIDRLVNGWYVLRINGDVVQTQRDTTVTFNSTSDILIGGFVSPSAGQGPFRGLIDSARVTVGRARHNHFDKITVPGTYPVA